MKPRLVRGLVALSMLVVGLAPPVAAAAPAVEIAQGALTGGWADEEAGIAVFRGIPYAAPPLGPLRWRAPEAPDAWEGVRDAGDFGPACPQSGVLTRLRWPLFRAFGVADRRIPAPAAMAEDCLRLNVWTPGLAPEEPAPVVVLLHGDGFSTGFAADPGLDGTALAREGLVVVTLDYRLGALGFFAHEALAEEADLATAGNYGLLDQIAALRWVQENAAALGGDPERVTLAGHSAGAMSAALLMTTPLAEGLFQRALLASPGELHGFLGRDEAMAIGRAFVRRLLERPPDDPLEALRALPQEVVLGAAILPFGVDPHLPIVDGRVIAEQPARAFLDGRAAPVPMLVGSTADEASLFAVLFGERDLESHRRLVAEAFGERAEQVMAHYPPDGEGGVVGARVRLETDRGFTCTARFLARGHAEAGNAAHLYRFERAAPGSAGERYGAFHGLDLLTLLASQPEGFPVEETDRELGLLMRRIVARFAATGDPNGDGLPDWPAYDPEADERLVLGETVEATAGKDTEACALFDAMVLEAIDDPFSP